ncbi:unnamed protein product, partial [Mesorhabditis spiculigera]
MLPSIFPGKFGSQKGIFDTQFYWNLREHAESASTLSPLTMPFPFTKLPTDLQQAAHAHLGFLEKASLFKATKQRTMARRSTPIPTCRKIRLISITMLSKGNFLFVACYSIEGLIQIECECSWPGVMQLGLKMAGVGDILMEAGESRATFEERVCLHDIKYGRAIELLNRLFYGTRPQASSVNVSDFSADPAIWPKDWRDEVRWPPGSLELFKRPFALVADDASESNLKSKLDWLQWSGCAAETAVMMSYKRLNERTLELLFESLPTTRHFVFHLPYGDTLDSDVEWTLWLTKAILDRPPKKHHQRITEVQFRLQKQFEQAELEASLQKVCSVSSEGDHATVSVCIRSNEEPWTLNFGAQARSIVGPRTTLSIGTTMLLIGSPASACSTLSEAVEQQQECGHAEVEHHQVVVPKSVYKNVPVGAAIAVNGNCAKSRGAEQDMELHAEQLRICATDENPDYEPKSADTIRQAVHLRARHPGFAAIMRLRSRLTMLTHTFFEENDYVHIDTPVLTSNDCEGAGETFTVHAKKHDYFGVNKKMFLSVSSQMHLEAMTSGIPRVCTIGSAFRADIQPHSRTHLAEFRMLEAEMAFCETLAEVCEVVEKYMLFVRKASRRSKGDVQLNRSFVKEESEEKFREQNAQPALIYRALQGNQTTTAGFGIY